MDHVLSEDNEICNNLIPSSSWAGPTVWAWSVNTSASHNDFSPSIKAPTSPPTWLKLVLTMRM
eukprot:1019436-Ditylum_brightwellii.AAC.1